MNMALGFWREVVVKIAVIDLFVLIPTVGVAVSYLVVVADASWPLWDRENRALHDMLVSTRVIRTLAISDKDAVATLA